MTKSETRGPRYTIRGARSTALAAALVLALASAASAQQPRTVAPGAPGQPGRVLTDAQQAPATGHSEADARFMRDMIVHHAQALVMAALVPERSMRADVQALARRIEASQDDEIAFMRRWLVRRGADAVDTHAPRGTHDHTAREGAAQHAHHHAGHDRAAQARDTAAHDHAGMPGMLSAAQLAELEAAQGETFDRLFLEYMIQHHEGALVMVAQLFATDGAAQDLELAQFAQHVDADQRIEIERMRAMLSAMNR